MDKYFFLEKFFKNKHILVAVSASIAIYKILDLLSLLNKLGAQTRVVMSESSAKFINPLIFEAISKNPVLLDSNQSWENPKACLCDEEQPDVSADHEDPAMRHVDDVQYTENQRVADGDDRIGASQR